MIIIRTQNRETLVEIDAVVIYTYPGEIEISGFKMGRDYYLGMYKSRARTMEILDEIQLKIVENTFMENTSLGSCSIYEMPKE